MGEVLRSSARLGDSETPRPRNVTELAAAHVSVTRGREALPTGPRSAAQTRNEDTTFRASRGTHAAKPGRNHAPASGVDRPRHGLVAAASRAERNGGGPAGLFPSLSPRSTRRGPSHWKHAHELLAVMIRRIFELVQRRRSRLPLGARGATTQRHADDGTVRCCTQPKPALLACAFVHSCRQPLTRDADAGSCWRSWCRWETLRGRLRQTSRAPRAYPGFPRF